MADLQKRFLEEPSVSLTEVFICLLIPTSGCLATSFSGDAAVTDAVPHYQLAGTHFANIGRMTG